jgi:hypothetical protein
LFCLEKVLGNCRGKIYVKIKGWRRGEERGGGGGEGEEGEKGEKGGRGGVGDLRQQGGIGPKKYNW